MIRGNKSRIIKYRKQDEKESAADNFVGFVADKEKKQKQPLIKASNHKEKEIAVNNSQPYSKRFEDANKFTKQLSQDNQIFQSHKKYLNDFEQFSDHDEHLLSSVKKAKQENVKLSMPKSYNPEQVLKNIQQSLINTLKKAQPQIRLDEIFGLQITQQIMGMIPQHKRALQIRPKRNPSLSQSKRSKMILHISNQKEFSQNHESTGTKNILNNSVKVDISVENQTQQPSLPKRFKEVAANNFESHNQAYVSPQMFFFHSRVFQPEEDQFDYQNRQSFPNNQNKLFKGEQTLNQMDENFQFLNDLAQIQDQQEHIQMGKFDLNDKYGFHQKHQCDPDYYQAVGKPKKIINKFKIQAYNQLLPYQTKFDHEISEQKHRFQDYQHNEQLYSQPRFQEYEFHSREYFQVENQEQKHVTVDNKSRFQEFFGNQTYDLSQFMSAQKNYDMLPPAMKQQFLNDTKKIKPKEKASIPSQMISQQQNQKYFMPVNQNYIDSNNFNPRDQKSRGIIKNTRR